MILSHEYQMLKQQFESLNELKTSYNVDLVANDASEGSIKTIFLNEKILQYSSKKAKMV